MKHTKQKSIANFIFFLLIIIVFIPIIGCTKNTQDVLKFGVMPDESAIPIIYAAEKGIFEKYDLNIEIIVFKSAIERDTALQTGNLDGTISDMCALIFMRDAGFDITITSRTFVDYKLIIGNNSNIKSIKDISGRKVGMSKGTVIEYATDYFTSQNNVDSYEKVFIPQIPIRLEMLEKSEIELAVLPDPLASFALNSGGKVAATTMEYGINPGIVVFRSRVITEQKLKIRNFYKAYNESIKILNNSAKVNDYFPILIEKLSFPEFMKEKYKIPYYEYASPASIDDFIKVIDWMKLRNYSNANYNFNEVSNYDFIYD